MADEEARGIWDAAHLDAESIGLHKAALLMRILDISAEALAEIEARVDGFES
jgi:hypothetical protein